VQYTQKEAATANEGGVRGKTLPCTPFFSVFSYDFKSRYLIPG